MIKVKEELERDTYGEYPRLKISAEGQIILFTARRTGTNINGKGWPIGDWSDSWAESKFKDYNGKIILENEDEA